ncbi:unnamed protein product [Arctia plantaginis]|uniref:Uncharacterized protein n=1 Tax=Arctia plantaginis TaxID=874455 RepID=A0A8S1B8Y9_ARCPL|nr:unnamed protein product [Arctia plantaginis]
MREVLDVANRVNCSKTQTVKKGFLLAEGFHSLSGRSEDTLNTVLPKAVDLEEADRETTNLLVFLLMQFLSRSDQAHPTEDKTTSKTQELVLKHLFLLLGYNYVEKCFHISPYTLRQSSIFNAFMANLPQVLDQNHVMGASIAEPTLLLLQCCCGAGSRACGAGSVHSLGALEPHVRRHWLMALLVVSYKLAETVNLHFLSLLESLLDCNSTVLNKLLPLWTPILHSPLFSVAKR